MKMKKMKKLLSVKDRKEEAIEIIKKRYPEITEYIEDAVKNIAKTSFVQKLIQKINWEDYIMLLSTLLSILMIASFFEPRLAIIPVIFGALLKSIKDIMMGGK